ncbi:hypothetical protein ADL22_06155 [Streptomyces sp. NRRL F-4489]|nr:hypothetical protein ADL22_06155 [Streptomyces sp. NRRL F-4489]
MQAVEVGEAVLHPQAVVVLAGDGPGAEEERGGRRGAVVQQLGPADRVGARVVVLPLPAAEQGGGVGDGQPGARDEFSAAALAQVPGQHHPEDVPPAQQDPGPPAQQALGVADVPLGLVVGVAVVRPVRRVVGAELPQNGVEADGFQNSHPLGSAGVCGEVMFREKFRPLAVRQAQFPRPAQHGPPVRFHRAPADSALAIGTVDHVPRKNTGLRRGAAGVEDGGMDQHRRAGRQAVDDHFAGERGGAEMFSGGFPGDLPVGSGEDGETSDGRVQPAEVMQGVHHRMGARARPVLLVIVVPGFSGGVRRAAVAVQMVEGEDRAEQPRQNVQQRPISEEFAVGGHFQLHERWRCARSGGIAAGRYRALLESAVHPVVGLRGEPLHQRIGEESGEDEIAPLGELPDPGGVQRP